MKHRLIAVCAMLIGGGILAGCDPGPMAPPAEDLLVPEFATTGGALGFTQVDGGFKHTCAIKTDNSLECWGSDGFGQASPPAGTDFVQVDAGDSHNCAVKTDNSVACWGSNFGFGESTPPAGTDFVQLSAAGTHACAVKTDNSLECWGRNGSGATCLVAGYQITGP